MVEKSNRHSTRRSTELQKPRVTDKFLYRAAVKEDEAVILECVLTGFLQTNSLAMAMKLTRNDTFEYLKWVVERSLHTPYSVIVHERSSGKLAGIRLYSVTHRDGTEDFQPFQLDCDSMSENGKLWYNIVHKLDQSIWSLQPDAQKILHHEITFTDPHFQRQGIANHFLNLLNIKQLTAEGIAGLQSEATSYQSQKMQRKLGYIELMESDQSELVYSDGSPIIFPDETKTLKLFFLPLNRMMPKSSL
ncbi:hypothetical protein PENTCL1PPCAC_197 [Pristionchus entomophagus]|uniref:N-acetyltransferase domain-containing protein n=1 Tax=Pristionchus entomophagus TaxID=358040 RepID=A0AAV5S721_9BILA|nr:hypothetical protein PENTCL1PPCAC_197 [Pristionchus entomophagus]